MPRNIVQDVIPKGGRRSIRDVSSSYTARESSKKDESDVEEENVEYEKPVRRQLQSARTGNDHSRFFLWLISAVAILVLTFILASFFSGATVNVVPTSQSISVNLDLIAKIKPLPTELGFTPLSVVKDKDMTVTADSEQKMETKATGKIIVYNNYSVGVQRLVKNTRFETPDGLIYRITESVTVPGRHTVSNQIVPGSIEVAVVADMVGSEYNIGLTDFTIPGFKSDSNRFASFYARSKTPMTGGKIGVEKVISPDKAQEIKKQLQKELTEAILAEIRSGVPEDSVFYESGYNITFETIPSGSKKDSNEVTVRERARATAFVFKKDDLAKFIAQGTLKSFDSSPLTIQGAEQVDFVLKSPLSFDSAVAGPIRFGLKGNVTLIWKVDEAKLQSDLAGISKKMLTEIIGKYSSIKSAEAVVRPIWKGTFPKDISKIKVVISKI